jgi:CRISPR-associated protein Cas1
MTEALYVIEPGSYLRRQGETLRIFKNREVVQDIPADGLKKLTLVGNISMTGNVLDYLIQRRVETVFMTPTGRYRARLAVNEHRHVARRMHQYLRLHDPNIARQTAGMVVRGKLENMARLLLLRARNYGDDALRVSVAKMRSLSKATGNAPGVEQIRGIEGAATNLYFASFPRLIRNEAFEFRGRNRRPPLDPVNALLSFVYTMLTNEVLSAINACGLDPYLGALHEVAYGRPSLACDLVEEYRPFLGDRLVLGLVNKRLIGPDDFVYRKNAQVEFQDETEMKAKRPVEMKPAICRTFIAAYEEMMRRSVHYPPLGKKLSYRWVLHQQARRFAEFLENPAERTYEPLLWEE